MIIDLQTLAEGLGVTKPGLLIILSTIVILIFVLYKDLSTKKEKNQLLITSLTMMMIFLWLSGALFTGATTFAPGRPLVENNWQEIYVAEAKQTLVYYDDYVADTEYYDYDDEVVATIAQTIASQSRDSAQAIYKTAAYVYDNVDYVFESDQTCFTSTAPQILVNGQGQCDTQSIAVIAILRKMGVAAQPVGGCIIQKTGCNIQAFGQQVPVIEPLTVTEQQEYYARGASGLHAWVVAWVPEKGWVSVESTAGLLADTNCFDYHVELFPTNNDKKSICVSTNYNYALACSNRDVAGLDQHGLGLVNEVNPK